MPRKISEAIELEKNKEFNSPFELYQVFLPDDTLYLAMFPKDIEFFDENGDSKTYSAAAISRRAISHNTDTEVDRMQLQIDNVSREWSAYAGATDLQGVKIVIWKAFLKREYVSNITWDSILDETDSWSDVWSEDETWKDKIPYSDFEYKVIGTFEDHVPLFEGNIDSISINEQAISVNVTSKLDKLDQRLPRRQFQLQCPWVFGDSETCGVSVPTQTGTIADIKQSGLILELDSISDNHWLFGSVEIGSVVRGVDEIDITANEIELNFPVPDTVSVGDSYTLTAGCSKVKGDDENGCEFWDNKEFFGGFPEMPKIRNIRG